MTNQHIYKFINYCIAIVWFVNGLICKVLDLVPRHEQIVARIIGNDYSRPLTILIGISEIFMGVWIQSNYKYKLNVIVQISVVLIMNTLEFLLSPDLLLWGKLNLVFAILFVFVVYLNAFYIKPTQPN